MDINQFSKPKMIIFLVASIFLLITAIYFKDVAMLFFGCFVLASAINPTVDNMSKRIPRALSVLIVFSLILLSILLFFIPIISISYKEISDLVNQAPKYYNNIHDYIINFSLYGKSINDYINLDTITFEDIKNTFLTFTGVGSNIFTQSLNLTKNITFIITVFFTVALIVIYMVIDKNKLHEGYLRLYPQSLKDRAEDITTTITNKVGGFVVSRLITMIIVGILTWLGLQILGIKYAVLLGLMAGLFDIIPIIGPVLAIIPAIIIALSSGWALLAGVISVYILAQWIVNTFINPVIFGKFLDLHPLIIIFFFIVSAKTLGVFGVILAPAIAATLCVIIEELYIKTINE